MLSLLLDANDGNQGDLFFLNGLLMVLTPIVAIGVPLLFLRRVPKHRRGYWVRGMMTTGLPALVVCIVVATLIAPPWAERHYVKTAFNAAELRRETTTMTGIIFRALILSLGTGLLTWFGGFWNNRINPEDAE